MCHLVVGAARSESKSSSRLDEGACTRDTATLTRVQVTLIVITAPRASVLDRVDEVRSRHWSLGREPDAGHTAIPPSFRHPNLP